MRFALYLFSLLTLFPVCVSAEPLTIAAEPFAEFLPGSQKKIFGKLEFLGGLELSSNHPEFGGISAARFDADGKLVMLTDKARVIVASLKRNGDKPISLEQASITRLRTEGGKTITGARDKDSESLEIVGQAYFIGFERNDRLQRFTRRKETFNGDRSYRVDLGSENIPNNRGAEALAYRSDTGKLYLITEMAMDDEGNHKGYIIANGKIEQRLKFKNRNGFSPTDASFVDEGSLILLERYYSPLTGVFLQMRRFTPVTLDGVEPFDGEILIEANRHHNIDNMEALAVSKSADGGTRLTLISDDNFSDSQRTLLLEFRLVE